MKKVKCEKCGYIEPIRIEVIDTVRQAWQELIVQLVKDMDDQYEQGLQERKQELVNGIVLGVLLIVVVYSVARWL